MAFETSASSRSGSQRRAPLPLTPLSRDTMAGLARSGNVSQLSRTAAVAMLVLAVVLPSVQSRAIAPLVIVDCRKEQYPADPNCPFRCPDNSCVKQSSTCVKSIDDCECDRFYKKCAPNPATAAALVLLLGEAAGAAPLARAPSAGADPENAWCRLFAAGRAGVPASATGPASVSRSCLAAPRTATVAATSAPRTLACGRA